MPIPHNPHCPKKLSSVISCHRQISCPCLCVAKNLLTLVTPGDSQGQAPCAVCYLLEQVFRFPSDRQKPSIFPLTNWQYLPGLGVGNSSCFSSFQTMCWTVHSKIHTSGAAKTFLSPISLLRDKTTLLKQQRVSKSSWAARFPERTIELGFLEQFPRTDP